MINKRKTLLFFYGFLGLVVLPLMINVASAPIGSRLYDFLKDSSWKLILFLGASLFVGMILFYFLERYTRLTSSTETTAKDQRREELIKGLAARYEKRLKKRMDDEINFRLELTLRYTKTGIPEQISKLYLRNYEERLHEHVGPLFNDFANEFRHILILGQPGSGKTVLLLKFAEYFLTLAEEDEKSPLPVIVNLASWRNSYRSFEAWLEESLIQAAGEYGTSKKYAKQMVQSANLLLLLDGLDEVPVEHRVSCLQRLDEMISRKTRRLKSWLQYPHVIITSRCAEFLAIRTAAPVRASIQIEPLDRLYVIDCLRNMEGVNAADKLVYRIEQNPSIANELTTAFNVHLALQLAERYDFEDCRSEILLLEYCQMQINMIKGYPPKKIVSYLHHLAFFITYTKGIVSFELTDIQPDWLSIESKYKESLRRGEKLFHGKNAYRVMLEVFRSFFFVFIYLIIITPIFLLIPDKAGLGFRIGFSLLLAIGSGFATGIVFALINGLFFKKKLIVNEMLQFKPAEFSMAKFFRRFVNISLRTMKVLVIIAVIAGVIAGISNTSITHSGGWKAGLRNSYKEGLGHLDYGFSLSVLPVYLHTLIILIIFIFSFHYCFVRKVYPSVTPTENSGQVYLLVRRLAIPFCNFTWTFFSLWALQGMILGFCYGLSQGPFFQFFYSLFNTVITGTYVAVFMGIIVGIYNGLIAGLFTTKSSITIYKPYRRFWRAILYELFRFLLPVTAIIILLVLVGARKKDITIQNALILIGIYLIIVLICFIICFYRSPLVNSFAVRFMLFIQGKMPLRYRHFLDKVSNTGLMEKDGGQWRFRHQLIQDLYTEIKL